MFPNEIDATGDWTADCSAGRAAAETMIAELRADDRPYLLAEAARRVATSGRWSGVEAGFFAAIGEAAS